MRGQNADERAARGPLRQDSRKSADLEIASAKSHRQHCYAQSIAGGDSERRRIVRAENGCRAGMHLDAGICCQRPVGLKARRHAKRVMPIDVTWIFGDSTTRKIRG